MPSVTALFLFWLLSTAFAFGCVAIVGVIGFVMLRNLVREWKRPYDS